MQPTALYGEFALAAELHRTHSELLYGERGAIDEQEFRRWQGFFRARNILQEIESNKSKNKPKGKRTRY